MNEIVKQTELFAEKTKKTKSDSHIYDEKLSYSQNITLNNLSKLNNDDENEETYKIASKTYQTASNWPKISLQSPDANLMPNDAFPISTFDNRSILNHLTQFTDKQVNQGDWLYEKTSSLDRELTYLRETSSPWNSSRDAHWNCQPKLDQNWDNSQWTSTLSNPTSTLFNPTSTLSNPTPTLINPTPTLINPTPTLSNLNSSQTPWNDCGINTWNQNQNQNQMMHINSWDSNDFAKLKTEVNSNSSEQQTAEPSLFNLFGKSLWTPITTNRNTTSNSPVSNSTNNNSTNSSSNFASYNNVFDLLNQNKQNNLK